MSGWWTYGLQDLLLFSPRAIGGCSSCTTLRPGLATPHPAPRRGHPRRGRPAACVVGPGRLGRTCGGMDLGRLELPLESVCRDQLGSRLCCAGFRPRGAAGRLVRHGPGPCASRREGPFRAWPASHSSSTHSSCTRLCRNSRAGRSSRRSFSASRRIRPRSRRSGSCRWRPRGARRAASRRSAGLVRGERGDPSRHGGAGSRDPADGGRSRRCFRALVQRRGTGFADAVSWGFDACTGLRSALDRRRSG